MNLEELVDVALKGLAATYRASRYENINHEPKYAKWFCELFDEAFNHNVNVANHQANYNKLKGIQ